MPYKSRTSKQPTLFLFQSLIALLCSNSSCLDKDILTLRAIYESSSPTRMPMCAPYLICNLYEYMNNFTWW